MPKRGRPPPEEPRESDQEISRVLKCATCGAQINPTAWHPVSTHFNDDGEFLLYAFCSIECRNDWRQNQSALTVRNELE
jgi:hypothetical protein